jgi:acetyl-CoA C-acetyltransferase
MAPSLFGFIAAAIRAGCPVTVAGTTVNRYCSSGLQATSIAAQRVIVDGAPVMVAGGVESISKVQDSMNVSDFTNAWMMEHKPELYMPMGQTAEVVARRYKVSRQSQDEYALMSQQRTAAAQTAGMIGEEIAPIDVTMEVRDKQTGETSQKSLHFAMDEGNRPDTTLEGLARLPPAFDPEGTVTAGN